MNLKILLNNSSPVSQQGSILISIIVTMALVASLGTAVVSMTNSSAFTQVESFSSVRTYYLAEAGGRYGIARLRANFQDADGNEALFNGRTYTLSDDNNEFKLTAIAHNYTSDSTKVEYYILTSTGRMTGTGAQQTITYKIKNPNPIDSSFDTPEEIAELFDEDTVVGNIFFKDTGPSEGPALNLKVDSTTDEGRVQVNSETVLEALADMWTASDELLSYQVQVKLGVADQIDYEEYMIGITFRGTDDDNFYGYWLELFIQWVISKV